MLNNNYNKATYGGLAVALTSVLVFIAQYFGYEIPAEIQGAITTLIAPLVVWAIPNKPKPEPPTESKVGFETIKLRD